MLTNQVKTHGKNTRDHICTQVFTKRRKIMLMMEFCPPSRQNGYTWVRLVCPTCYRALFNALVVNDVYVNEFRFVNLYLPKR